MEVKVNRVARPAPAPAAAAAPIAAVFGCGDLLREILLRLDHPACLVRAAAVCRRWLRLACDPAFLREFRELHPPDLLGYYVQDISPGRPLFVPVSDAPELAAAARRAAVAVAVDRLTIRGCRDGRLLVRDSDAAEPQNAVLSPLHPTRGVALVPPPPRPTFSRFFLDEDGGVVALEVRHIRRAFQAQVITLQSGVWALRASAAIQLPYELSTIGDVLPPVRGKMYMQTAGFGHILGLDLAAQSLLLIRLPDRVNTGNFRLSCGEDSGLVLIHAEGFLLSIWKLRTDSNAAHEWVLVEDGILVSEAFNRLQHVLVLGADDKAEFVILGLQRSGVLICMNLRSRVEKVHHERFTDMGLVFIFPLMIAWPPIFPALREVIKRSDLVLFT